MGVRILGPLCGLAIGLPGLALAAEGGDKAAAPGPVSYYRDVRPVFVKHCQGCHQPAKPSGKLVITSHAAILGGEEPAVTPGKPENSPLFLEISPRDGKPPAMPKDREPLAAKEVELIRRWIAEGALDDTPESEKVVVSMEKPPVYASPPVITSLDFSPDSQLLAVSGNNEVLLHKGDGSGIAARLVGLSERIESAVFSPDGKRLAVTGGSPGRLGEVQVWDIEKQKLLVSVPVTFDTVYGASWSPDGARIAFGCSDNTVRVVEAETGKQVLFNGAHGDWVLDTVFSADASHLVSVSRDRSMKLIQVATEQFIDNITSITPGALKGGLIAIDRHPQKDELLVGGADGAPKIYQMHRTKARQIGDDFNLIRAFEVMPGRIFAVEFSADGSLIAAGSSLDGKGELRVYQAADGKKVSSFQLAESTIYALSFRADGQVLAIGGFDGKVRLLDAATGKLLKEYLSVPVSF
jgi:WD40 repeat protein